MIVANPIEILQKYFGYNAFRLQQAKAVEHVINGRDVFVLMPTGGGKSLCYQVPALALHGTAIVISPLIALMKDQVDALRANGIPCAYLNSSLTTAEQNNILELLKAGKLKLLYIAPEKLNADNGAMLKLFRQLPISLFAIDEAHCVSHWGHDFRPDYLFLNQLKGTYPTVPIIALTASADDITRKDIVKQLNLHDPAILVSSFNRANINYYVQPKQRMTSKIIAYVEDHSQDSGIIYCLSRKGTEEMAETLKEQGISAHHYHAGMAPQERALVQEKFIKDKIRIIVATIAFGMGIDKSNVRFVIHADLPKNIESYYQETGRAGRDGLSSEAILFYSPGDVMKMKRFAMIEGNTAQSELMLRKLQQMADFAEMQSCRRQYLMRYFGEAHAGNCKSCDYCLSTFSEEDATIDSQKLLSAVLRLKERYGKHLVIDFLRGSNGLKITDHMRSLPTYARGKDKSKDYWLHLTKHLLLQGFLQESNDNYAVLKLTEQSREILYEGRKVLISQLKEKAEAIISEELETMTGMASALADNDLFQLLRELRKEHAENENVPPYVVFSDATLKEMAAYFPQTPEELGQISGLGVFKMEKYGRSFLKLIVDYCVHNRIASRVVIKTKRISKAKTVQENTKSAKEKQPDTVQRTLHLYKEGHSISEIASIRNYAITTIEGHLSACVASGELEAGRFVSAPKLHAIEKVAKEKGVLSLRVIKDVLGEDYSYFEIKVGIAFMSFNEQ